MFFFSLSLSSSLSKKGYEVWHSHVFLPFFFSFSFFSSFPSLVGCGLRTLERFQMRGSISKFYGFASGFKKKKKKKQVCFLGQQFLKNAFEITWIWFNRMNSFRTNDDSDLFYRIVSIIINIVKLLEQTICINDDLVVMNNLQ